MACPSISYPMYRVHVSMVYVIYDPGTLSSALALLGRHSSGCLGYKFYRPLGFEVYIDDVVLIVAALILSSIFLWL